MSACIAIKVITVEGFIIAIVNTVKDFIVDDMPNGNLLMVFGGD